MVDYRFVKPTDSIWVVINAFDGKDVGHTTLGKFGTKQWRAMIGFLSEEEAKKHIDIPLMLHETTLGEALTACTSWDYVGVRIHDPKSENRYRDYAPASPVAEPVKTLDDDTKTVTELSDTVQKSNAKNQVT